MPYDEYIEDLGIGDGDGDTNSNTNETEEEDTPMGKLKRSALLHYLDESMNGTTASWFLIGKDVEDMSVELNPQTEAFRNILDEQSVTDNGYEPSMSVETYFADPSDGDFYDVIKDIAMERKTGDDCKTSVLEVLIDKTTGPFDAWKQDCIIKPTSYGGAPGGVRIPYTVTFIGDRVAGTVTMSGKVPTFSAAT